MCVSSLLGFKLFLEAKVSLKHASEGLGHPLPASRNRLPVVFITGSVEFDWVFFFVCIMKVRAFLFRVYAGKYSRVDVFIPSMMARVR